MAETKKITAIKVSNSDTQYNIDLPSDATPDITSLTTDSLTVSGTSNLTDVIIDRTLNGTTVPDNPKFTDTVYTLPVATSSVLGGVKVGYTTSEKNYKLQVDSSGNGYVNVPWTDTNTWRGIQDNLTSTSTTDSLSANQGKVLNDALANKADADHTHTLSIATSSATNQITLSHGTRYQLTAGGSTYVFTMPSQSVPSYATYLKVTSNNTSANRYLVASSTYSSSTSATAYVYSNIYLNHNTGQLTATTFNATSDARLKENITPYENDKSVLDLPVYHYDFIDGVKDQIGCLAQDLQKICPEIVNEEENGYLTITESKIVYLLLEELKKQNSRIAELEKKLGDR